MPTSESETLTDIASESGQIADFVCVQDHKIMMYDVSNLNYGRFKIQSKAVSEPSELPYKTSILQSNHNGLFYPIFVCTIHFYGY